MQWLAIAHQALASTVCFDVLRVGMHVACAYLRTRAHHMDVACSGSRKSAARRSAHRTSHFATCIAVFKTTAVGAKKRKASASVAARRVKLQEVEEDLGQTAFGAK